MLIRNYFCSVENESNMLSNHLLLVTALSIAASTTEGRQGFGPGDQDWGYVEVRPFCHMFWWLHYTTAVDDHTERPLLIWLQGGPGFSASGSGNIDMSGLVDRDLNMRDYAWVHKANVLYVDSPVGAGYSYVQEDQGGHFATNTSEITSDFIQLLAGFFKEHPEFETVPLYLMGESYGGKLAPAFGEMLLKTVDARELRANLQGIGMAYPGVDIFNSFQSLPETLYQAGILDNFGRQIAAMNVYGIYQALEENNHKLALEILYAFLDYIKDTYKIHDFDFTQFGGTDLNEATKELNEFMDTTISPLLNLTMPFGVQQSQVNSAIWDKLIPTTNSVIYLLDNTDAKVTVYNGQLDWMLNTNAAYNWAANLKWHGGDEWNSANRYAFYADGIHEGHVKEFENFAFYWVKRAGHSLPNHNPNAVNYILEKLIGFKFPVGQ